MTLAPCAHLLWQQRPRGAAGNHAASGNPRFAWLEADRPVPVREDGRMPHRQRLAALGVDRLIDAHTHWFPENVMRKIWGYFHRHNWPIAYEMAPERRLDWLLNNGVRHFTTLNYAHRPAMAAWLNEWSAEFAARTPQAIPFGTFYPEAGVADYVRTAIEEYGLRGFKLHVRVGAMALTDRLLRPAFEQVEAAGLPMVLHIGTAPEPGEFTAPRFLHGLLAAHPRLRVVIAHMGGWEFEEYLGLAERNPRVFLDTTMVFVGFNACDPFPPALLPRLAGIGEQVLFGSDYPIIPYPLSHAVEGILDLPLPDGVKRGILGANAARLFGVTVQPGDGGADGPHGPQPVTP
jgi:hypothetical protein